VGLLYSASTAFLGFEVNERKYKVMGMARMVQKLIRMRDDGSFELDMDYFSFHHSTNKTFNRKPFYLQPVLEGGRNLIIRGQGPP
jgi:carbamoyltransferase